MLKHLKIIISLAHVVAIARGQSANIATFDVASIRTNTSGDSARYLRPQPGRLTVSNMTVRDLLMFAYDLRDFQVVGGPGWISSEHFDIEATTGGNTTQQQLKQMLQTLFKERFRLQSHMDERDLSIYELVVAKTGLKMKPLKEGGCVTIDPDHPRSATQQDVAVCGNLSNGRGTFDAANASMVDIAKMLSFAVGRTVEDRTNVQGLFPVHLRFSPDDNGVNLDPAAGTDNGPSVFTALQEQLGLRLQASKGPVRVMVIDHVERPSNN